MATSKRQDINAGFFTALHCQKAYKHPIMLNSNLANILLFLGVLPTYLNLIQMNRLFVRVDILLNSFLICNIY